jgi:hypothetical protein
MAGREKTSRPSRKSLTHKSELISVSMYLSLRISVATDNILKKKNGGLRNFNEISFTLSIKV